MSGSAQFFIKVLGAGLILAVLVPLMFATEEGADWRWWLLVGALPVIYSLLFWLWARRTARREDARQARVRDAYDRKGRQLPPDKSG